MANDEKRIVPLKNYIILVLVLGLSLLFVYYLYMWYVAYQDNRLSKPILNKYMETINYNELEDYLIENRDTIIYVSILEDEEIRNFEKEFRKEFKRNRIINDLLYMDISDEINDNQIRNDMNNKYKINGHSIIDVPAVMVFENGILKEIYNVTADNYDIEELRIFVNNISFNGDN